MNKYDQKRAAIYRGRPHSHYRNKGKNKCRSCGKPTNNYWHCHECLDKMSRDEIEGPVTDCLGQELEVAW